METLVYRQNVQSGIVLPTPGNVAPLGATETQYRLKQTLPSMNRRFAPDSTGAKAAKKFGAKVSQPSKVRTIQPPPSNLRERGTKITDTVVNQSRHEEPRVNSVNRYQWKLKVGQAKSAYGTLFQDLPGGYGPEPYSMLRGTSTPRMTLVPGDPAPPEVQGRYVMEQIYNQLKTAEAQNTGRALNT